MRAASLRVRFPWTPQVRESAQRVLEVRCVPEATMLPSAIGAASSPAAQRPEPSRQLSGSARAASRADGLQPAGDVKNSER
jgi:hypothetical protein